MSYGFNIRSDVTYEGAGYYRTTCLECGEAFSTKRRDAQYHDATCRKRANRRRRKVLADARLVVSIVGELQRMRTRQDLRTEVAEALRVIRASLET